MNEEFMFWRFLSPSSSVDLRQRLAGLERVISGKIEVQSGVQLSFRQLFLAVRQQSHSQVIVIDRLFGSFAHAILK